MDRDKLYHFKSAMHLAFRDISEHLYEEYPELKNSHNKYIVTPFYLTNKNTRALNRQLGLHLPNRYKKPEKYIDWLINEKPL